VEQLKGIIRTKDQQMDLLQEKCTYSTLAYQNSTILLLSLFWLTFFSGWNGCVEDTFGWDRARATDCKVTTPPPPTTNTTSTVGLLNVAYSNTLLEPKFRGHSSNTDPHSGFCSSVLCSELMQCIHCRDTIENRDNSITERDANIMNLQRQTENATEQLKVRIVRNLHTILSF